MTGYRHEALLYAGLDDFVDRVGDFVADGLDAGEPTLVVVDKIKIDALREAFGDGAGEVEFANMAEVGDNPARIIAAWRTFVDRFEGTPVRGIGEPIVPERNPNELRECHLHESLLNVAFRPDEPFRLTCPYDISALPADVVSTARRTHPTVDRRPSGDYEPVDPSEPFGAPLAAAPSGAAPVPFGDGQLSMVRAMASALAGEHRLPLGRTDDFVIALNEVATNAIEHGGGNGVLRMWHDDDHVVAEVADAGRIADALIGRLPPALDLESRRGLWLANQLCDLVQIHSSECGTTVRLFVRMGSPPTGYHGVPGPLSSGDAP